MSAVRFMAFADRPWSFDQDVQEISRFSCMLFLSVRGFFDYAGPINPLAINVVVVLPSSLSERSRHPDPSVFRSSIVRPTDTSVYASSDTSRCRLQNSRPGWSRWLLSCRALSSPTTCRFTPAHSDIPTYQELRRGWVNTAALLGSGSLIRYESVPEALRPLGGEVARVSAWSRGERSRPACGRLGCGGQPNDDENRVVLLVAAVHGRHGRPRIHRKTLRGSVRRRARVGSLRRRVACGAASEMGDIVEGRAVGEFPPLIAVFVLGVNCQHSRHFAVTRDEIFPSSQRKGRLLHDEAVFFQPPIRSVEFPLRRRHAGRLQLRVVVQLASARARILVPEAP